MEFQDWINRTEAQSDAVTEAPLRGLAALLNADVHVWGGIAPPLAHWLYFLPTAQQSAIDVDGHPKRGGFLPPVDLPRRMWAGGRLRFEAPLAVGRDAERVSTIKTITRKTGASGDMIFVTVTHEVRVDDILAVKEEQDIVYRGPAGAAPPIAPERRVSVESRAILPDAIELFRFSALTFNAHRIHYDREYAMNVEGYPGLVVQGPYIATLLMHHALRRRAPGAVRSFSFRALRPLFGGQPAELCADDAGALWCRNDAGETVMTAQVEVE